MSINYRSLVDQCSFLGNCKATDLRYIFICLKMDMRFRNSNVRSLYRAGALGLVTSEMDRCRMDLVGVQEVRWEGSSTFESGNYTLFYGEGNANHQLGTRFLVHRRIRSVIKMVEFISERVSCSLLH